MKLLIANIDKIKEDLEFYEANVKFNDESSVMEPNEAKSPIKVKQIVNEKDLKNYETTVCC